LQHRRLRLPLLLLLLFGESEFVSADLTLEAAIVGKQDDMLRRPMVRLICGCFYLLQVLEPSSIYIYIVPKTRREKIFHIDIRFFQKNRTSQMRRKHRIWYLLLLGEESKKEKQIQVCTNDM